MDIREAKPDIILHPEPGFVIKSHILESKDSPKRPISSKVFINLCKNEKVPKPKTDFDPEIVFPLIMKNEWEIPLILSNEKLGRDKKGQQCFIYDCCINSTCFRWCQVSADLRLILIEWCLEAVELMYNVFLDRNYTIPKMMSKGELSETIVRSDELDESGFQRELQQLKNNDTLGLIQELRTDNEQIMSSEDDDKKELPNLTNIYSTEKPSKVSTPLIQEINQMRIEEINQDRTGGGAKSSSSPLKEKKKKERQKYAYEVSYQKVEQIYSLIIKIQFAELESAKKLSLTYAPESHSLQLKNNNSDYCFKPASNPSNDMIDIPIPNSIAIDSKSPIKCFFDKSRNQIILFL